MSAHVRQPRLLAIGLALALLAPAATWADGEPEPEPVGVLGHRAWTTARAPLSGLAFAAGGKHLIALSRMDLVVFDAATGRTVRRIGDAWSSSFGPSLSQVVPAVSRDGARLVCHASDGVRLVDTTTGRVLSLLATKHDPTAVALAPDGRTIACARDGAIDLFDGLGGTFLRSVPGHEGKVRTLAFSPDGRWLASAGVDKVIRLWDVAKGAAAGSLAGHAHHVLDLAWSPDGARLASAGRDATVRVWHVARRERLHRLLTGHSDAASVAWSPDGSELAAGAQGVVRVWHPETGAVLRTLEGYATYVTGLAYAPDGARLAATHHAHVRIWDRATETQRPEEPIGRVLSLAFSPDGQRLVTASVHGGVRVWDVARRTVLRRIDTGLRPHATRLWMPLLATWAPSEGGVIATSSPRVALWRPRDGERLTLLPAARGYVTTLACSGDGARLVVAGFGPVRVVDLATRQVVAALRWKRAQRTGGAALSRDGSRVAVIASDQAVRVLEVSSGELLHQLIPDTFEHLRAVAWSPDDALIAAAGQQGSVRLWRADTGAAVAPLPYSVEARCLAWSRDGARLAVGHADGAVRVWDVAGRRVLRRLEGNKAHRDEVTCLAFDPAGARLASGSRDGTVLLWNVARD